MAGSPGLGVGVGEKVAGAGTVLRSLLAASNGLRAVRTSRRWQTGVLLRRPGSRFVASTKSLPASDVPIVFP